MYSVTFDVLIIILEGLSTSNSNKIKLLFFYRTFDVLLEDPSNKNV